MFKESLGVLKDIEKTYGKKTALALDQYCKLKKLDPAYVAFDTTQDKNGMTPWDWFDNYARKKLGIDIMDNFDDTIDWTGTSGKGVDKEREIPIYDSPTRGDMYGESGGRDPQDVLDFLVEEMRDCEWIADITFDDYAPICYLESDDGKRFVVSVDWDK